jgi:hypothetical protein
MNLLYQLIQYYQLSLMSLMRLLYQQHHLYL